MKRILQERGNALVLSVFTLLTLTSLGIVSIQRAKTDMLVAGNLAKADISNVESQSCTEYGAYEASQQWWWIRSQIQAWHSANPGVIGDPIVWFGGLSTAVTANFSHLAILVPNNPTPADLQLAINQQKSACDFIAHPSKEKFPVAGNGIDSVCTYIWDIYARAGTPGSMGETLQTTLGPTTDFYQYPNVNTNTVIMRTRSKVTLGPINCD